MAKTKEKEVDSEKSVNASDKMLSSIKKDFGAGIVVDANYVMDKKTIVIPVSPALDLILGGGIPEGSFVVFTGQPKCGKSLANSSIVYTPKGPKKMGEISLGDIVNTPAGDTAEVIGVYPQGEMDIYEVTFNDGSKAKCTLDHNWTVAKNNRSNKFITMSLEEILKSGLRYNDRYKWKISLTQPVQFNRNDKLEIDPYIFGCLIGDGCLSAKTPGMSTCDKSIRKKFTTYAKNNKLKITIKNNIDFHIVEQSKNSGNTLTKKLKRINIMGTNSHTKFIPESYKYSSLKNRLKLIRGLMDTDGSSDGFRAEYTSVSETLAKDVQEILQSLGYTAKIVSRYTSYTGSNQKFLSYRLYIHGNNIDSLFQLKRKKFNNPRKKPPLFRTITNVSHICREKATCIKINTQDGLFLTNEFIITHNTLTSLSFAANAQKPEYGNRNVYYFNVEGRIKPRDLAGIPGINKEKFHIIGSEQGNILTAEKFLQIADRVINEEPGCVVIIDSYSALCTETELTSDMDKMQRADGPKLLSKFCRKVANVIAVNKNIVIGITHLMGNPGNGHAEWKEKSGQGIGYQGDVKLRAKYHTLWSLTQEGNPIGQEVHWTVQWCALGAPGGETVSYIRYGEGIDEYKEVIELAISFGLIEKTGSWYTLSFLEDKPKFQGTEKIRNYLIENKEIYNNLYLDIKKMLGFVKE